VGHQGGAHPSLVARVGAPSARLPGADHVAHPAVGPAGHHLLSAEQTRAPSLGRGRGHDLAAHPGGAVHAPALHHGARAAAPDADRGQTDRSDPGRQPLNSDRHFHGGDVWLDPAGQTRPPPVGPRLPGEPPSALARPLAARHIGRAALPSATFPHTLPAVRQVRRRVSPALRRTASGIARQSQLILPP